EHVISAELAGNFAYGFSGILVVNGRSAGDDPEAFGVEPAKMRDDFFREAVSEEFLLRIAAEILERENHEHPSPIGSGPGRPLDGCNKTIAPPRYGFDKSRALSGIAKQLPNLADGCVQAVLESNDRIRPEPFPEDAPGDDLAGLFQ